MLVEPIWIEHDDGFLMQSHLRPSPNLKQFSKRSCTAGERNEYITQGHYFRFACVHIVLNKKLSRAPVGELPLDQRPRYHTDNFATGKEGGIRQNTHQAHDPTTIDDTVARLAERGTKR